jgi:uncharacterized membrane protein YcaP (DUF421 family)
MSSFELILVFLVGGIMIQAIVVDDHSFTNAIVAVSTVAAMHVGVHALKLRSEAIRKMVDGTPIVLLEEGAWHRDRMRQAEILEEDVMAAARAAGALRLEQVRHAILERNGAITIVKQPS